MTTQPEEEIKVLSNQQILYHVRKVLDHALQPRMRQLKSSKETEAIYIRELTLTHMDFTQSNPSLFYTIVDNPQMFDITRLIEMLDKRQKIADKRITQNDADKEIGQKYYDEFGKPLVNSLDKK